MTGQSKRFPFTKRTIEALPSHDPDSPSREAEYSDAECIGLHFPDCGIGNNCVIC
jgi:hypothetical protein